MEVLWREQLMADVPVDDCWLSTREIARLATLHIPKRRADWRLGRWTVKRSFAEHLKLSADCEVFKAIEVLPNSSGAPEIFYLDKPFPIAVSLSHRAGVAACTLAPGPCRIGCDLEVVEARSEAFVRDYFTDEEQDLIAKTPAADRATVVALLWSAKESALKAVEEGLRLDTRSVSIDLDGDTTMSINDVPAVNDGNNSAAWRPLRALWNDGRLHYGAWRSTAGMVRTVVVRVLIPSN